MLILVVVALCVVILLTLILLARRGTGSMGQKEVRKRMKHLL